MSDAYEIKIADLEQHLSQLEDDNKALKNEFKNLIVVIRNFAHEQNPEILLKYFEENQEYLMRLLK